MGLVFLEDILIIFGATEAVLAYSLDYMKIILSGSVFLAIGTGVNGFIRSEGKPKTAMITMIIGAITNIILDYIFIFIFNWGIKGAAIATVISYMVISTWVLHYFFLNKATVLVLSRQVIIFIPLLIILPHYWGLEGV